MSCVTGSVSLQREAIMSELTENPVPTGTQPVEPEFMLLHKNEEKSDNQANMWDIVPLDADYALKDVQKVVREGVESGILPCGQYAVLAEGVRMGLTDKGEIIYKQEKDTGESTALKDFQW
jgi:hypothetical protein